MSKISYFIVSADNFDYTFWSEIDIRIIRINHFSNVKVSLEIQFEFKKSLKEIALCVLFITPEPSSSS